MIISQTICFVKHKKENKKVLTKTFSCFIMCLTKQQKRGNEMENYEIQIHERKYINQDDVQVTVSFQLPFRDWLTIEKSNEWCQIEKLLLEIRNTHNQKYHQDQK